jgi:diguanylate cyclase (GGDEF)-like protein
MGIDLQTFRSHFARRLFLFVFSAVALPVAVLAVVTIVQVTDHLLNEHQRKLGRDAKQAGMLLFERLNHIGADISSVASAASPAPGEVERIAPHSQPWPWLDAQPLSNAPLGDLPDTAGARQMLLRFIDTPSGVQIVSLYRAPSGGWLAARIAEPALWDSQNWSEDLSVCVFKDDRPLPFCTIKDLEALGAALAQARLRSSTGHFRWSAGDEPSLAAYWGSNFYNVGLNGQWTVVMSEEEATFFAPIDHFQNNLISVILIAILGAVMVGISQIKRVLRPLEQLHQATRAVEKGELGQAVVVKSGDEFEALADSFNRMTCRLAEQFRQLDGLARIDHLILSSTDPHTTVREVTVQVRALLGVRYLAVCTPTPSGPVCQLHSDGSVRSASLTHQQYESELDQDKGVVVTASEAPIWIQDSAREQGTLWLKVMLRSQQNTVGIAVLGFGPEQSTSPEHMAHALQSVDRITMALGRALWQQQLHQQANSDDLTGLPNRLALRNALDAATRNASSTQRSLAVLFLDLDRFKLINDSIGHAVGDRYLKVISQRIASCVSGGDMVARLGGDEFTLVLHSDSPDESIQDKSVRIARELMNSIPAPVHEGSDILRSTMSIGIATFPQHGTTPGELMKHADAAMYCAKHAGGNAYRFYTEDMSHAAQARLGLEAQMRKALEEDQFELHYQPKVDVDANVIGAEALIRWRHPEQGMVSPAVFIPIAEESILIGEIDAWVLDAACRQIRDWRKAGLCNVPISVNVSASQFQRGDFVSHIQGLLEKYAIHPDQIELEITESAVMTNLESALGTLHALRDLGVSLAIDDFGTGYSSLAYLKRMPVNTLKIDKSFVRDIAEGGSDAAIVHAILQLCAHLGLTSVAEGVETIEEREWLHQHGCDVYQGYFYHRPMAAGSFAGLLRTSVPNRNAGALAGS